MIYEEELILHIENGIRAIHLGTKPADTKAPVALNKLKVINEGMYSDYLEKYKRALKDYKHKNEIK